MGNLLIAYITETGSTKEVAEEIARVLESKKVSTIVKAVGEINTLEGYDGIIIGAPINGMMWHPKATEFVKNNSTKLKTIPTAYFSLSYTIYEGRKFFRNRIMKACNNASKMVKPIHVGAFGGKIDKPLPSFMSFVFGISKDAKLDQRDWDLIKVWAAELATKF